MMSKLQAEMQKMQEAPIEYLVFSGGGAKGAIYPGVYAALAESRVVMGVKAVAGSSAGAITAAMVAAGVEPEEFTRISGETNFKDLLGKKGVSLGPLMIGKDGKPLYELVDKAIRAGIKSFLDKADITVCAEDRLIKISEEQQQLEQEKLDLLQQRQRLNQEDNDAIIAAEEGVKTLDLQRQVLNRQVEKIQAIIANNGEEFKELYSRCQNNDKIFFNDLANLRLLDPVRFKDLLISAVRRDNGELTIFSAENTPDVEIASAVRASASIPVVFAPQVIDGIERVDGGYRDNIPMQYFLRDDDELILVEDGFEYIKEQKKQGRILVLAFGSGMTDSANIAIYSAKKFDSPNAIMNFLIDIVFKMLARVGGKFKYSETKRATENQLREAALNTVVLDTQGISTLDFDDAQKKADYLYTKGRVQTLEYLDNHELGRVVDDLFEMEKFCLAVYERYEDKTLNKPISRKILAQILPGEEIAREKTWQERDIVKIHQDKADLLLSFCGPELWNNKDQKTVLTEYVIIAATGRHNRKVSCETKSMESLIATLNNPATPNKVKENFIKLLAIDKMHDPRLISDQAPQNLAKNIAKFKFDKTDFQEFIDRNKHQGLKLDSGGSKSRAVNRQQG
jgi:NTE family protein